MTQLKLMTLVRKGDDVLSDSADEGKSRKAGFFTILVRGVAISR